jgi:formamidopyrimidine-DNA glycosylase
MPELPEVETIRRQLDKGLKGKTVSEVYIFQTGREFPRGEEFVKRAVGRRLLGVDRRAKILVFQFESGEAILGHLKMTGKFLFVEEEYEPTKHDRILFVFTDETRVMWSDVRKFGYVKFVTAEEKKAELSKYGPEPLDTSIDELAERLLTPKTRKVKSALLDQETIAGIGNIYADEALHRARIQPMRKLSSLSADDRKRLATEIVKVLTESVKRQGTSSDDYRDTKGKRGGFQGSLQVYGRTNKPCKTCETPITKIVLGGRGTHYCVNCQK